jgi:large conductance mechanosensitive channel
MGLVSEFKAFAIKGNVVDLAIGVVIGGAFSKIIGSLVEDIITPAVLKPALTAAHLTDLTELTIPGTAIKYGNFISTLISFIIVAISLFLVVKAINASKKKEEAKPIAPPEPSVSEKLLMEIRDSLKK